MLVGIFFLIEVRVCNVMYYRFELLKFVERALLIQEECLHFRSSAALSVRLFLSSVRLYPSLVAFYKVTSLGNYRLTAT
jgi:hypothetical protein